MRQFQVIPLENLTVKADDWTKWIKHFERFCIVFGLETQADKNQVNALIYTMSEKAEDISVSLHLTPEDTNDYEPIKRRLDAHFLASRNTIFQQT